MKLRVEVDHVVASIALDGAWTPELLATLLRQCGDEVVRVCLSIADVEDEETGVEPDGPPVSQ